MKGQLRLSYLVVDTYKKVYRRKYMKYFLIATFKLPLVYYISFKILFTITDLIYKVGLPLSKLKYSKCLKSHLNMFHYKQISQ